MNILIVTHTRLDSAEAEGLTRAVAEFGHISLVSVEPSDIHGHEPNPRLTQPELPEMQERYPDATFFQLDGATLSGCVQLALTAEDWLPAIDLVIVGAEQRSCFGVEAWMSPQTLAALLAFEFGVTSISLFQAEGERQQWDGIGYAVERLVRLLSAEPALPHVALHVNVPNLRPNELEGFSIVQHCDIRPSATRLVRNGAPWTFQQINSSEQTVTGTDRWAVMNGRVAVSPLWGWRPGDLAAQHETLATICTSIALLGSSRAYRAAIDRTLNKDVHYDYLFKGALLGAGPGFCAKHSAKPFSSDVNASVEAPILTYATGRVLDVGCGPGRIAIYLATKRPQSVSEVVGIDSNATSLADYERRWLQHASLPCMTYCLDARVDDFRTLGKFDSILLFGDTLGIGGDTAGVCHLLSRLHGVTRLGGKLIISGRDPIRSDNPDELFINDDNARRGFPPGERFLRITFENHDSGWFPCYYASPQELRELGSVTGWKFLEESLRTNEPNYYGVVMEAI